MCGRNKSKTLSSNPQSEFDVCHTYDILNHKSKIHPPNEVKIP